MQCHIFFSCIARELSKYCQKKLVRRLCLTNWAIQWWAWKLYPVFISSIWYTTNSNLYMLRTLLALKLVGFISHERMLWLFHPLANCNCWTSNYIQPCVRSLKNLPVHYTARVSILHNGKVHKWNPAICSWKVSNGYWHTRRQAPLRFSEMCMLSSVCQCNKPMNLTLNEMRKAGLNWKDARFKANSRHPSVWMESRW